MRARRMRGAGGAPAVQIPVSTGLPSISGVSAVGQVLAAYDGAWTNSPTGHVRQWLRDTVEIAAATSSTYLLVEDDEGSEITLRVVASNSAGPSLPATSASVGPVTGAGDVPVTSDIVVGAAWYAADGRDGQWGEEEPDPSICYDARTLPGSNQQPGINIMTRWSQVFTDPLAIGLQIRLIDFGAGSPTFGRRVPCKLRWHAPGASGDVTEETTRSGTDLLGRPWSKRRYWVDLQLPTDFLAPELNSEAAFIDLYFEAIPLWEGFDSHLEGPYRYYPRDASGVVEKTIHKSGAGAGANFSTMAAAYGSVAAEFTSSGRASRFKVIDTGHDWELARAAASSVCPFWTEIVPGLDTVTGEQVEYTLGDHAAFPAYGYSSPGINRLVFKGHKHDTGKTGGIVNRSATTNEIAFEDHETFCTHFPAGPITVGVSPVLYDKYGTGTGQATLIRGRQPAAYVSLNAGSAGVLATTNGYFHDLPNTAIVSHIIDDNNWGHDISGTPIEDRRGGVYGGEWSRFGGYYSGLITSPGDDNPGMALTFTGGGGWFVSTRLVTGNAGNYLDFWYDAGGNPTTATLTASLELKASEYVAELVGRINANVTTLAVVTAADITGDVELDQTHLTVSGQPTTQPLPKTAIGAGLNMTLNRDIHAAAIAMNMATKGQRRRNTTVVDRSWPGYCGAASATGSMKDGGTANDEPAGTIAVYDDYYTGCGWHDDCGYYDRNGDWRIVHPEAGYITAGARGRGFLDCTWTGPVHTAAPGIQFGTSGAHNTVEQAGVANCYGQIGAFNFLDEFGVVNSVSPYQSMPTGSVNSKFVGSLGSTKDPTEAFNDPANGDWTVLEGSTVAICPDGVEIAGIFNLEGERKSHL